MNTTRGLRTRVGLTAVMLTASVGMAQPAVWQKNIPDAFQHQRWGARPGANPGGLPAIAGAADAGGDTIEILTVGQRQMLFGWQVSGVRNPPHAPPNAARADALATFNGWCNIATYTNQLYHFKQRGFNTMGAVNTADGLHTEVKSLARDYFTSMLATTDNPNEAFSKLMNKVLVSRDVNPVGGPRAREGLTAQNYGQADANVVFRSATGATKNLPKTTLFDHLQTSFTFGDSASLRLGYAPPANLPANAPQRELWWSGPSVVNGRETGAFHSVAVAGFDKGGNGTIFFADPDSNPTGNSNDGNRGADAGWREAFPNAGNANANLIASSDNWLAAPPAAGAANNRVKQRRFAGGAGVPVPAAAAPTAAEQSRLYFEGTLNNAKTQFAIANADFNRYDTVQIRYMETLEVVKGGKKPRVPGAGPEPTAFQVSPGIGPDAAPTQGGAPIAMGEINEVYLFAAVDAERIVEVSNLRVDDVPVISTVVPDLSITVPGLWNIYFFAPGDFDPFGNLLEHGGVKLWAGDGLDSLAGLQLLEFDYLTSSGDELSAWDLMYNDRRVPEFASLGVQSVGGLSGFDLPLLQIPTPGALGLMGVGLVVGARRRRA